MTWTDLASSVPVDHPPSSPVASSFSTLHNHTSRPGTPIVTPRARSNFAVHKTSVTRPVSCLTNLGTPPEESDEEEEEEEKKEEEVEEKEEEEEEEKEEEERVRREEKSENTKRRRVRDIEETVDNVASSLSGFSLSSGRRWERHPAVKTAPSTPPGEERRSKEVGVSVSCVRRLLTATTRPCSATPTSYKARHSKYCNCSSSHDNTEVTMVDTKVIYASSHDPQFPPGAAVDGRLDTFWASSGLYPQFLVMSLPGMTSIENINIVAYNVRKVSIARSIKTQPTDFEEIKEEEMDQIEGKLQESLLVSQQVNAIHLRITITEGHSHFCSVHRITITGSVNTSHGSAPPPVVAAQLAAKTPARDTPAPKTPARVTPASKTPVRATPAPKTPVRATPVPVTPAKAPEASIETMSITSSLQSLQSPVNKPLSPTYMEVQSPDQMQKSPTKLTVVESVNEEEADDDMVSVFRNSDLQRLDDDDNEDEF